MQFSRGIKSTFQGHFIKKFSSLFFFSPPAMLAAKRQDGGLFKSPPYPGYPFIMIPDLTSPYLPNGSLSPTARTVSSFIYCWILCTHTQTHTLFLHSHRHGVRVGSRTRECFCHPEVLPLNTQSQLLQLLVKCTVRRHARAAPRLRCCCSCWTEASMLALLSEEKNKQKQNMKIVFTLILILFLL